MRVLDVGSGVGDVAMLAARLVGPSGGVVGLERDPRSAERARTRAAKAGFANIDFVCCDVDEYAPAAPFDGAVGRFVLQFLPDPLTTLRRIAAFVKRDGLIAFQEGSWAPFLALSAQLPLWHACVSLLHEAGRRGGVNLEMGVELDRLFRAAGLNAPKIRLEMELGRDPEFTRWPSDSLRSVLPVLKRLGLDYDALGDFDTLQQRLHDEVACANRVVPWIGLVGAWTHT